jgi:hypothetical protein
MNEWVFEVPEELFRTFASDPTGPLDKLLLATNDPSCAFYADSNRLLDAIPPGAISETCKDETFLLFHGEAKDYDRPARIWFAERFLIDEISRRKLRLIKEGDSEVRPVPYYFSACSDIEVGDDHLAKLSQFEFDGARLIHNENAFTILSTTESPNSTYWLLQILYSEGLARNASVRLDPFLWGAIDTFPAMHYKMLVYARPLCWQRIASLQQEEHGRWRPDSSNGWSEFTDFCWTPRGSEIHFTCEEVPKMSHAERNAARYCHAIYSKDCELITHFDGALRLYTSQELQARHSTHVRRCGKAGHRIKVFKLDTAVPKESFSLVSQAFFIWNTDVINYFRLALSGA